MCAQEAAAFLEETANKKRAEVAAIAAAEVHTRHDVMCDVMHNAPGRSCITHHGQQRAVFVGVCALCEIAQLCHRTQSRR
jgi:hypothetical protein